MNQGPRSLLLFLASLFTFACVSARSDGLTETQKRHEDGGGPDQSDGPEDSIDSAPDAASDAEIDLQRDSATDRIDGASDTRQGHDGLSSSHCDPRATFTSIASLLVNQSDTHEVGAWLSPDQHTLFFASSRPETTSSNYHIFRADRTDLGLLFPTAPVALGSLNPGGSETKPSLTGDGKTMYAAAIDQSGMARIGVSVWNDATASFSTLTKVSINDAASTSVDGSPYVLSSHTALYFSSTRAGGRGNNDLYRAAHDVLTGAFGIPSPIGGPVNTADDEDNPVVTSDELTLYFSSDRHDGNLSEIYVAIRPDPASNFDTPTLVGGLSSPSYDSPDWISEDNCTLYFHSYRNGSYDVFVATRALPQ